RDAALIAVLYGAGLRRSEAAALGIEHFNQETGELRITGKGNRQRLVYATYGSLNALKAWLMVRGTHPGALFPAINKAGRIIPGQVTSQAIYNMLVKRAEQAGLEHFMLTNRRVPRSKDTSRNVLGGTDAKFDRGKPAAPSFISAVSPVD